LDKKVLVFDWLVYFKPTLDIFATNLHSSVFISCF